MYNKCCTKKKLKQKRMSQFDPLVAASDYFLRKEVKARSGKEILARLRGIVCHTYTSVQE